MSFISLAVVPVSHGGMDGEEPATDAKNAVKRTVCLPTTRRLGNGPQGQRDRNGLAVDHSYNPTHICIATYVDSIRSQISLSFPTLACGKVNGTIARSYM